MTLDLHATAADRLRDDGQRYTTRRRALVDLLTAVDQPLTIAELLQRQPGLAQSSAYRNLAVLERAGWCTASSRPTSSPATSWPRTSRTTTTT